MVHPEESDDEHPPLASCEGYCELGVPEGGHRVQVAGPPGSDIRTSGSSVDLYGDADIFIRAPHQSARNSGLLWGIIGVIVAPNAFGGLLLSAGCAADESCGSDSGLRDLLWPAVIVSGVLLVGGVTAAALGWRAFGLNNGPQIEVIPVAARRASSISLWSPGRF